MFENIKSGWKLGSAIRKLVFTDKKLFLFPIIAGIIIIVETVAIFGSFLLLNNYNSYIDILLVFLYYIVVYFTSVYILIAMFISFRDFGKKQPVSISKAMSETSKYLLLIFEWALFESIVTMIIRAIEQRLGPIGATIFGFAASMAMGVATAFAIPVIVDKRTGPISTLKESTTFIIKNFGKTFGGLAYTELYSIMFVIAGVLILVASIFVILPSYFVVGVSVALIGLIILVFGALLGYILSNIYRFVLYDYMNGGKLPSGITEDMVNSSIKKRRQRSGTGGMFGGNGGGFVSQ